MARLIRSFVWWAFDRPPAFLRAFDLVIALCALVLWVECRSPWLLLQFVVALAMCMANASWHLQNMLRAFYKRLVLAAALRG